MKRFLLLLAGLASLAVVAGFAFVTLRFNSLSTQTFSPPSFRIAEDVATADLALGHRIYSVRAGCIDCHGADGSGAIVMENGPIGSIRGANLTPFALAKRTDEQIAAAIRYGVHPEGRSLRFMPSFDYAGLSKGDTAALVAYLRSLPPISNPAPANAYGPLARVLSSLGQMPVMFPATSIDQTKGFAEKPPEGPNAAFGQYLASSCIGCHGEQLAGGPIPGGDPSWPPAGNSRLGANPAWTRESFERMIRSGVSPTTGAHLRPPMPTALLSQLNDDEIAALWAYLSSLH